MPHQLGGGITNDVICLSVCLFRAPSSKTVHIMAMVTAEHRPQPSGHTTAAVLQRHVGNNC